MKNIFLVSDLGAVEKINGVRFSKELDNKNQFIDNLKNSLNNQNKILFFASDPDGYEKTDTYSKLIFESLNKSGFSFNEYKVVDHRYTGILEEDIKTADLVFLSGGYTPLEMVYYEEIKLRDLLKNYEGVIIGQSAGAINLASIVVYTPEYEEELSKFKMTYKGLDKTNINIEPHFTLEPKDTKIREILLDITKEYPLYAICDGSYIHITDNKNILYGEAYYIDKKVIKKICSDKESIEVKED